MDLLPVDIGYWIHKDEISPYDAAYLLCGYEPPTTHGIPPLQKIIDAQRWLSDSGLVQVEDHNDTGFVRRVVPRSYVRMADLLLAVGRAQLPNPFGTELLEANKQRQLPVVKELSAVKELPSPERSSTLPIHEQRKNALREYLLQHYPGEDWLVLRVSRKVLHTGLQEAYPKLFHISHGTFNRHFLKNQSICKLIK